MSKKATATATKPETKVEVVATVTAEPVAPQVTEPAKVEKLTFDQKIADELIQLHGNKSKAIRAMSAEGKTRSQIATILGIRYQHVNNVLKQPMKREIKAARDNGNAATEAAQ